jgi:molybdate transport system substrate-binding protein
VHRRHLFLKLLGSIITRLCAAVNRRGLPQGCNLGAPADAVPRRQYAFPQIADVPRRALGREDDMTAWRVFALAAMVGMIGAVAGARAAEVIILVNQGAASAVHDLVPAFERASGHKVVVSFEVGPSMMQKINSDAPADVVSLFVDSFDDLVKRGKVVPGSAVEFARAGNGVAVKAGAPKPDISTPEAFKRAMLAAKSIGYSRVGSGLLAARLMERLGIADELKPKTKFIEGIPVAEAVARGDVEIGLQQTNVIQPVAGSDYVGPVPAELQEYVRFAVGLLTRSQQPEAAQALIHFMAAPENAALVRKSAMEPPAR